MSSRGFSRSPSPNPAAQGWATPTLSSPRQPISRASTPKSYALNGSTHEVSWASAQAKSAQVNGATKRPSGGYGLGFLGKVGRKVSQGLPLWTDEDGLKDKPFNPSSPGGRGAGVKSWIRGVVRMGMRARLRSLLLLLLVIVSYIFLHGPIRYFYRRTSWLGGGKKYVVILAANMGGGVMEWKGPREWAIERDSVRNKKRYVARWGYELEIVDMSTKKRYAHEWRESWEKVDTIRNAMRKYPHAEWFWWLDLNTFIMEPSYSLQHHVFNDLGRNTYRDINHYNPLNITHPLTDEYLDEESRSPIGDGKASSINVVIPQDCGGFNLGSFFVRRSPWTDRLLDIWWDPVGYEQKHMEWEHKEQDALEAMYKNQPWVRNKLAFINQRRINSFPAGACGEKGDDPHIHYNSKQRDFVVNMAGCEWGRDCWGEMYNFRELSNWLNRTRWEKFKDGLSDLAKKIRGQKIEEKRA
ncbi:putative alpha-1,6-mannosyltransferase MNN10 [Elsinoe australis]|uniref:Putative alpha-1,6-mannosyltransferase MNN10 n=1 Tax=Elsinoe australis TaxID=40998 RepID=A0A4U7B487_9PEZI|nr:putative alpha-1,6-mannosyltransferase MNN10 [Elsinoe australis]